MGVEWGAGLVEGEGRGRGRGGGWEVCRDVACGSDIEATWKGHGGELVDGEVG